MEKVSDKTSIHHQDFDQCWLVLPPKSYTMVISLSHMIGAVALING